MKALAFLLAAIPLLFPAAAFGHREPSDLKARELQLEVTISEIRRLYRDEHTFIAAFDAAQKKWAEYCSAMLAARFPAKKKHEAYGSVYELAYAATKIGFVEARIKELTLWVMGTEEGDVTRGSVKLQSELDEIRKEKVANQPVQPTPGSVTPRASESSSR